MPTYRRPWANDDNAMAYAEAVIEAQEYLEEIEEYLDSHGGLSPEMINADDISDAEAVKYHLLAATRLIAWINQRNAEREYFDEETFVQMDEQFKQEFS